jgi:hypothetical protein
MITRRAAPEFTLWVARRESSKELPAGRMMALLPVVSVRALRPVETRLVGLRLRQAERLQALAVRPLLPQESQAWRRARLEQRRRASRRLVWRRARLRLGLAARTESGQLAKACGLASR